MSKPSRTPAIWRCMSKLNRRIAVTAIGRGRGPRRVVLLLTSTGRKSGQSHVTPLQFEKERDVIYVASARGPRADWFRNVQANPRVKVQIDDRAFDGLAEPITDPARIADFLQLRLRRHPIMMRLMLALEGQLRCNRTALERFAAGKAMIAIREP